MIKKKVSKMEEAEKEKTDEITDNKDINSQDEKGSGEETENSGTEGMSDRTESGAEPKEPQPDTEPVKEATGETTAEAKLAEMQDRYLRLSAEFDNYRKRTLREKIELTKHAGEALLLNIIPVMDDFERAMKAMDSSSDIIAMKAGIDLIYNKFRDFLAQNGIKEIEALNSDFNVDLHDAISKLPAADDSQKGKVVEVVQKGYYLHEKVVRHSKVVVGE
jgi:molecular chaperone GrpE